MDTTGRGGDLDAGLSILSEGCVDSFEMPGAAAELGSVQDDSFITSLGSSGPLLSSSRLGISNLSQDDSVKWNVGDDGIFEPWTSSVHSAVTRFISCSATKGSMSPGFSEVLKRDPEEWESLMALKEDGREKCTRAGGTNSPPLAVGTRLTCEGHPTSGTTSNGEFIV